LGEVGRASGGQDRGEITDWPKLIEAVDGWWTSPQWEGTAFFDTFPDPTAVSYDDETWLSAKGYHFQYVMTVKIPIDSMTFGGPIRNCNIGKKC
jgi:hypothetical protein